jgi:hypothetical protein
MTSIELIETLLEKYDGSFRLSVGTECCWGGELRLTMTNPPLAPSRSITFYACAGAGPEDIATALYKDYLAWIDSLPTYSTRPLPPQTV